MQDSSLIIYQFVSRFIGTIVRHPWWTSFLTAAILVAALIAAAAVIYLIFNYIVRVVFTTIARRTKTQWDDIIVDRHVLRYLCHLLPGIIIFQGVKQIFPDTPEYLGLIRAMRTLASLYMVSMVIVAINAFLNALHDIYMTLAISKQRPIKPYIQVLQIILFLFGGIILVSIIIKKNPITLILGLSAMAAVLLLVFKDAILGLVASVQASANNMVKPGDWIEMPSRNADGIVMEITLSTVKVQNWDRTISTFPTYALVSESFQNWKGMEESDGRRIKRSIYIDMNTIHFCSDAELEKFKRIGLLTDYIETQQKALSEFNEGLNTDMSVRVNGRRLTNIGVFRKYVNNYLLEHPNLSKEATCMARLLQPTEKGVPLEVYCFSTEKAWVKYEGVQSDIFDHLFAIMPEFNLRIFQNLSGTDLGGMRLIDTCVPQSDQTA